MRPRMIHQAIRFHHFAADKSLCVILRVWK